VTNLTLPGQFPSGGSASLNQLHIAPKPPSLRDVSRNTIDDASLDAYQREFDYLMRTFQRLGVASSDAEDLAHEVFLVLRRTWHEYDPARPLKPYLFGIAFRVAASHRRRRWREVPFAVVEGLDHSPRPDQLVEANQARTLVLGALQRIPIPRRVVLVMHDLDEIPVQEVAETLAIPLFTAYSRLRKARQELEAAIMHMQKRSDVR
jgi:RNA polymerase sigma-70 factor, ECF subfamily